MSCIATAANDGYRVGAMILFAHTRYLYKKMIPTASTGRGGRGHTVAVLQATTAAVAVEAAAALVEAAAHLLWGHVNYSQLQLNCPQTQH